MTDTPNPETHYTIRALVEIVVPAEALLYAKNIAFAKLEQAKLRVIYVEEAH